MDRSKTASWKRRRNYSFYEQHLGKQSKVEKGVGVPHRICLAQTGFTPVKRGFLILRIILYMSETDTVNVDLTSFKSICSSVTLKRFSISGPGFEISLEKCCSHNSGWMWDDCLGFCFCLCAKFFHESPGLLIIFRKIGKNSGYMFPQPFKNGVCWIDGSPVLDGRSLPDT